MPAAAAARVWPAARRKGSISAIRLRSAWSGSSVPEKDTARAGVGFRVGPAKAGPYLPSHEHLHHGFAHRTGAGQRSVRVGGEEDHEGLLREVDPALRLVDEKADVQLRIELAVAR